MIQNKTSDELLDMADAARLKLSYFNAAEGECFVQERAARFEARKAWREIEAELKARNLKARPGNYLI
jgi:hypothetical protein